MEHYQIVDCGGRVMGNLEMPTPSSEGAGPDCPHVNHTGLVRDRTYCNDCKKWVEMPSSAAEAPASSPVRELPPQEMAAALRLLHYDLVDIETLLEKSLGWQMVLAEAAQPTQPTPSSEGEAPASSPRFFTPLSAEDILTEPSATTTVAEWIQTMEDWQDRTASRIARLEQAAESSSGAGSLEVVAGWSEMLCPSCLVNLRVTLERSALTEPTTASGRSTSSTAGERAPSTQESAGEGC